MRTKIAALLMEASSFLDEESGHATDQGRCRALIDEMGRTIRDLVALSTELRRERDALASRLTRGSSVISSGKALLDVQSPSVELGGRSDTAEGSDWDGGVSPRSGQ